jgi:hypothetical protein
MFTFMVCRRHILGTFIPESSGLSFMAVSTRQGPKADVLYNVLYVYGHLSEYESLFF